MVVCSFFIPTRNKGRPPEDLSKHTERYKGVFQVPSISSFQFQIRYGKVSDIQIAIEAINTTAKSRQKR